MENIVKFKIQDKIEDYTLLIGDLKEELRNYEEIYFHKNRYYHGCPELITRAENKFEVLNEQIDMLTRVIATLNETLLIASKYPDEMEESELEANKTNHEMLACFYPDRYSHEKFIQFLMKDYTVDEILTL